MTFYGITIPDLVRFFMQAGLAVAGAASLWGFIFSLKEKRAPDFKILSALLLWVFTVAAIVFLVSWWAGATFFFPLEAGAHEGIRIAPEQNIISQGFSVTRLPVAVFIIAWMLNLAARRSRGFQKYAPFVWFLQAVAASVVALLLAYTGEFSRVQAYFSFHNWHSILTLGTVIVIDSLFLFSIVVSRVKKELYSFFPTMSLWVWIGLGLDFLSNFLVLKEVFVVTPQFLFSQTVVGIIILNGAFLSGRMNDMLFLSAQKVQPAFERHINRILSATGSISIVSWLAITFVDFFTLTLAYWQMIGIYAAAIVFAYVVHYGIDQLLKAAARQR